VKRIPIVATLVVLALAGCMIALGIWQLHRATWKEALLAEYADNARQPPIAFPAVPRPDEHLLYRRARGNCLEVTGWTARGGSSRAGESGWRHIGQCRTGAEGPGMTVDFGWSRSADNPAARISGPVSGVMDFDRDHVFILVADRPVPGLAPGAVPSPENIPNNHRAYAVQWFIFAALALIIYAIALRRRLIGTDNQPPSA